MRSRLTKLLSLLFALALVSAACGSDSDAETTSAGDADESADDASGELDCAVDSLPLHADGKLTIATGEPVFPPWMIDDDPANGEGFESAVAYALAEEMGFEQTDVEWVRTDFDVAIAPGEKEYDFNMQQYSPLPERDEVVDFSVPYYRSSKSVLAVGTSPAVGATTFADLTEAKWGATIGTTDLAYIEDQIGIEDVAVYDTQADTVAAMVAGQIDATVVSLPTALYLSAVELDDGVIAGVLPSAGDNEEGEAMSLLFTEGNELVSCVDLALESLRSAGTLDALAETWLQGDGDIPNITK